MISTHTHRSLEAFRYGLLLALATSLSSCLMPPQRGSRLASDAYQYSGNIALSLTHPYEAAKDDYELLVAVPLATKAVSVCEGNVPTSCSPAFKRYFESNLIYAYDHKKFFRTKVSALLEEDLVLTIVATDEAGVQSDVRVLKFTTKDGSSSPASKTDATSTSSSTEVSTSSTTTTATATATATATQSDGGASEGLAQVRTTVSQYCGGSGCHADYAADPELLKKESSTAGRLRSGNMPQGRSMPEDSKQLLLKFLGG